MIHFFCTLNKSKTMLFLLSLTLLMSNILVESEAASVDVFQNGGHLKEPGLDRLKRSHSKCNDNLDRAGNILTENIAVPVEIESRDDRSGVFGMVIYGILGVLCSEI